MTESTSTSASFPIPSYENATAKHNESKPAESFTFTGTVTDIHKTHSIAFTYPITESISILQSAHISPNSEDTDLLALVKDLRSKNHNSIFKKYKSSAGNSVSRPCGICSFQNLGRYRRVAVDLYYVFSTSKLSEGELMVKAVPICKDMMGNCRKRAYESLKTMVESEINSDGLGTKAAFISEETSGPLPGPPAENLGCELCGKNADTVMKRCTRCKVAKYCDADCQKRDWKRHKNECKEGALEELMATLQAAEQKIGLRREFIERKQQVVKTTSPALGDAPPAYY